MGKIVVELPVPPGKDGKWLSEEISDICMDHNVIDEVPNSSGNCRVIGDEDELIEASLKL